MNDKSDAFRHSYFQAINTRSVRATITKLFSDAHESEVPTQLILEKEMDLFNNQVGIDYAVNTPHRLSLSLLIMDALIRGELRYLSPTLPPPFDQFGNPIPGGDPLFNSPHGITSAIQLVPTNL